MTVSEVIAKAVADVVSGVSLLDGDPGIHSQAYYESYMIAGGWA